MAYTPTTWVNDVTAINATRMNNIESGVDANDQAITDHLADTTDAHDASAISVADAGTFYTATEVEGVLQEIGTQLGDVASEIAYVEFTSAVSVTATAEATPTDVVSSGAITYSGTRILIEFFASEMKTGSTAGSFVIATLWDASTDLGRIALVENSGTDVNAAPVMARRYLTPSAGSHTYKIRAWRVNSNGTVAAGAGGSGNSLPGYIRISSAP